MPCGRTAATLANQDQLPAVRGQAPQRDPAQTPPGGSSPRKLCKYKLVAHVVILPARSAAVTHKGRHRRQPAPALPRARLGQAAQEGRRELPSGSAGCPRGGRAVQPGEQPRGVRRQQRHGEVAQRRQARGVAGAARARGGSGACEPAARRGDGSAGSGLGGRCGAPAPDHQQRHQTAQHALQDTALQHVTGFG
jgi:hypothetical protein